MKGRDITEDEIIKITNKCKIREKAFLTIMRQSGLLPHTIKELKIENLEKILDPNTPRPCKIEIPNEKFPIFIGEEAVQYIKQYLETRATKETLTLTSLLFTTKNNPNKKINTKDVSRAFAQVAQKLKKDGKIYYKTESREPSELRLSSLTQFYKNKYGNYLTELHNNTTFQDIEFYRKLYEEKAMNYLEIEPQTTADTHRLRKQQQELEKNLEKIKKIILPKATEYRVPPKYLKKFLKEYQKEIEEYQEQMKEDEERIEYEKERTEWEKENPKEAKQQQEKLKKLKEEWNKSTQKYLDEHPEAKLQEQSFQIEHLKTRVNELENTLREITETLLKQKPLRKSAKKHKGNPPTLG